MKNNKVTTALDKNFFDNIFEPKRRQIQKQLGLTNLSQVQFTSMIKGLKIKIKINKSKQNRKYAPKLRGFNFNV